MYFKRAGKIQRQLHLANIWMQS